MQFKNAPENKHTDSKRNNKTNQTCKRMQKKTNHPSIIRNKYHNSKVKESNNKLHETTSTMSDSSISDKLPHTSIPQMSRELNHKTIKEVEKKLISNVASI